MQVAMVTQTKGHPTAASWRVAVDRAWRSTSIRRAFEADTGQAPLKVGSEELAAQNMSGATRAYHDRFLIWATSYLGLEKEAPSVIREKLAKN